MEDLNDLETAVLAKMLSGDHPVLAALRTQAASVRVVRRELTGVGFFSDLEIPTQIRAVDSIANLEISDVAGEAPGLANGMGFVLFVRDGRLAMLEGFTYDEPWPASHPAVTLHYAPGPTRDLSKLELARG